MNNRVLIDASPLVALFDKSDNKHKNVKNFLKEQNYRFISTLAVYTEVSYMLSFSTDAQQAFYEWVAHRGIIIADINQHDIPRIAELIKRYDDLPMDFADATLIVTAEKTDIREIISLDSDFDVYRLSGNERIQRISM